MGPSTTLFDRKLCQTSSSALWACRASATQDEVVLVPARRITTRSAKGDGPKTPEHLGYRPTGTSLLSLARTASCRFSRGRVLPSKCVQPEFNRVCWVTVVHPCREDISIRIAVILGNRTLRVVSGSMTTTK
jgi:hypothetical protein